MNRASYEPLSLAAAALSIRRRIWIALVVALAAACGGDGGGNGGPSGPPTPPPPPQDPNTVAIADNVFNPTTRTVTLGATVTWVNNGTQPHNTVAADGSWASPNLAPGGTYERTFGAAGSFAYSCTLHPGMNGTIVVQ